MRLGYAATIILIGVILTLFMNRKNLAIPFTITLPFLPSYINFPIGPVNIWSSDIISLLVLFLVIVMGASKSPTRLLAMDFLLPFACFWRGVGLFASGESLDTSVQGAIRWFIPWVIPYLIGRFGVGSWEGMKRTVQAMLWIGIPLSACAAFEAITGLNVLGLLGIGHHPTNIKAEFGLWRAKGTFSSLHILGMYLAVGCVLGISLYFAHQGKKKIFLILAVIMGAGSFASTSSTGVMQGMASICFMVMYRFRAYWKIWAYGFLAANIFVHFASSDGIHYFYARRLGALGEAYYRAVLIDTVIAHMPGRWIFGQGNNLITLWHVSYEDICNQWLFFLAKGGLPSFLALVIFYICMLLRLRECYALLSDFRGERIFLWGVLSTLVAVIVSWFFVALFGSDIGLFSVYFGMVVSLPDLARAALNNREPAD